MTYLSLIIYHMPQELAYKEIPAWRPFPKNIALYSVSHGIYMYTTLPVTRTISVE